MDVCEVNCSKNNSDQCCQSSHSNFLSSSFPADDCSTFCAHMHTLFHSSTECTQVISSKTLLAVSFHSQVLYIFKFCIQSRWRRNIEVFYTDVTANNWNWNSSKNTLFMRKCTYVIVISWCIIKGLAGFFFFHNLTRQLDRWDIKTEILHIHLEKPRSELLFQLVLILINQSASHQSASMTQTFTSSHTINIVIGCNWCTWWWFSDLSDYFSSLLHMSSCLIHPLGSAINMVIL